MIRRFDRVQVLAVTDGDTIKVRVSLDDDTWRDLTVRLARINTMELTDKDPEKRAKAWDARNYVASLIVGVTARVDLVSLKSDKYGRRVGEIWWNAGEMTNLSDHLLAVGKAEPYR